MDRDHRQVRPQLQQYTAFGGERLGDCHRTCIAMILDLDRDEVPHFMADVPYDAGPESPECIAAEQAERDWMAQRGLVPIHWGYDGDTPLLEVLAVLGRLVRGSAVILGCTSGNGVNHSVVVHEGCIYNPAGGNATIAGPMRDGFWIVTAYAHLTQPIADPVEQPDEPYIEQLHDGAGAPSVVTQED